jgi:autotransporter adhesin
VATAAGAVAIGQTSQATGANAIAIGNGAVATGSIAVGNLASAANGGAAFGDNSAATGSLATAIGPGAMATLAGSTAIGAGAVTTRANQMVLGTANATYTAPGIASAASLAAQSGSTYYVTSDASGNLATSSIGPGTITNLVGRVDGLSNRVDALGLQVDALGARIGDVDREARAAAAMGIASSQLRYDQRPGKLSIGAAAGTFRGESAFATGLGFTSFDQRWRANVSGTNNMRGDWGVGGGVTFTLN